MTFARSHYEIVVNPFADIHVRPPPTAFPVDPSKIELIVVQCPVRGRGLLVHKLTEQHHPLLFGFSRDLARHDGAMQVECNRG